MRVMPQVFALSGVSFLVLVAVGCTGGGAAPSAEGRRYLMDTEPQGALAVVEAKEAVAAAGSVDALRVVGRIGGGDNPTWDSTQAAFLISDLSLQPAEAHQHEGHDDNCLFCQAKKQHAAESMALVQVVDDQGQPVAADARQLLGLREGQVIVAQGRGQADELGNLVVSATKVYVRR